MSIRSSIAPYIYPPEVLLGEQFNFGNREVYLAANGIPGDSIFAASLQHGWAARRTEPPIRNRFFGVYPTLVWSKRIVDEMATSRSDKSIAIGSPWAHLIRACGVNPEIRNESTNRRRKLLYFPSHSTPDSLASIELNIERLRREFKDVDVTVCLFWLDFVSPDNRAYFENLGCSVVCVGSRGSAALDTPWSPVGGRVLFMPRLLELILQSDIIGVAAVVSPLWYALSLGKTVYIEQGSEKLSTWTKDKRFTSDLTYEAAKLEIKSYLPKFSYQVEIEPTQSLQEIALAELGWEESQNFTPESIEEFLEPTKLDPELLLPINRFILEWNNAKCL
jgi:hypothetical protein